MTRLSSVGVLCISYLESWAGVMMKFSRCTVAKGALVENQDELADNSSAAIP